MPPFCEAKTGRESAIGPEGEKVCADPLISMTEYPRVEGLTTRPKTVFPLPAVDPKKPASPKLKMPPSEATNQ